MSKGNGGGKFALGALIGAAVGAVAALLTAPKSGEETRKEIKDKATEVSHETMRQLRKVEGELNKRISDAKRMASKYEGQARAEVDALIARAEKMKDQATKMVEDVKRDAKEQVDEKFMADVRKVIDDLEDLRDDAIARAKKESKGKK